MEKLHLQPSIQEKKKPWGKKAECKVRQVCRNEMLHFIQTVININEYNIVSQYYKAILALMGTSP